MAPSRERLVNESASVRIVRNRFKLQPRLLMIRVAHFIKRIPKLLSVVFWWRSGSIVGAICSSKILFISGKKRKTSFVIVRQRFMRSRTTQREYGLDLKFSDCSDEEWPGDTRLLVPDGRCSNISTVKAKFCTISLTMV